MHEKSTIDDGDAQLRRTEVLRSTSHWRGNLCALDSHRFRVERRYPRLLLVVTTWTIMEMRARHSLVARPPTACRGRCHSLLHKGLYAGISCQGAAKFEVPRQLLTRLDMNVHVARLSAAVGVNGVSELLADEGNARL